MKLTEEKIRKEAGTDIYRRGFRAYQKNKVKLIDINLKKFEAQVDGKTSYHVTVQEIGENLYSTCTCAYWTTCKHAVAAMLAARDWYAQNRKKLLHEQTHPAWRQFFERVLSHEPEEPQPSQKVQQFKVIYLLSLSAESWALTPQKAYIKKNGFLGRLSNIGEFNLEDKDLLYSPNDPIIVSFLQRQNVQNQSFYNTRFFSDYQFKDMHIYQYKYGSRLGALFDLIRDSTIYLEPYQDQLAPVEWEESTARIDFRFIKKGRQFILKPYVRIEDREEELDLGYKILTEDPIWLFKDNSLIKVENQRSSALLVPFTKDDITLTIPEKEFPTFLEEMYSRLTRNTFIPIPDLLVMTIVNKISQKKILLQENEKHLHISLLFDYNGFEIEYNNPEPVLFKKETKGVVKIIREKREENKAREQLLATGLKERKSGQLWVAESKALNWLFKHIPLLARDGFEILGREKLKKYKFRTGQPSVRVAVKSNIDWFDLNIEIDIEGIQLTLKELRRAVQQNVRYVKLMDNSIAQIPDQWFKRFQHLFNFAKMDKETVHVPEYHLTLIDILFEEAEFTQMDEKYHQSLRKLRNFKGIEEEPLPPAMKKILRPYQKAGYNWLNFLKKYSFGGCLADDMGLGKTLQTLALLLHEKNQGNKTPSLIVCPTSVVFNWETEVQKFTPDLNVLLHTGLNRDRRTHRFNDYDIILTSYGIMRRDIAFLKDFRFHYVILDESQKIKNPLSQTAKASRLLTGSHRLVLTGTPVENNTIELWSQFAFLNPGLLGSLNYFRREFTSPIEKKNDPEISAMLRNLIYPFILRRTKESVARELPPKVEQTFYCAMNPEQAVLYDHWKNYYRALILDKIDTEGMDKARMNVLEGLVKLRQIACHPHLVDKNVDEDSGKFEFLKEIVEEIVSENHKILLFSQFVKMLRILRPHLKDNNIEYAYLDGHTIDRKAQVDRFQNDDNVKLFLISLKAGGLGLNLTAADYVIHYDPWWNPAVEVQATDRAHRIGQYKKVFVYRLITKNSVEEKMLELQARKRKLVSDLISTDTHFFKSLNRDDIQILFE